MVPNHLFHRFFDTVKYDNEASKNFGYISIFSDVLSSSRPSASKRLINNAICKVIIFIYMSLLKSKRPVYFAAWCLKIVCFIFFSALVLLCLLLLAKALFGCCGSSDFHHNNEGQGVLSGRVIIFFTLSKKANMEAFSRYLSANYQ